MTVMMPRARLSFKEGGTPIARDFDDVYFSVEDGLAESRFVFLDGIGGSKELVSKPEYTILETGFGTGLNFLMTWQAWREAAMTLSRSQKMTFISLEAFPLSPEEIRQVLSPWQVLTEMRERLLEVYPPPSKGMHILDFEEKGEGGRLHRLRLILIFAEAQTAVAALKARVDGFYLDGFAPHKNPEMWHEGLYRQLSRVAVKGARLASFTAAGHVRRSLAAQGFQMSKARGYGRKRERLLGRYEGQGASYESRAPFEVKCDEEKGTPSKIITEGLQSQPWYDIGPAWQDKNLIKRVAVIGAGIAGNSVAYALRERGIEVDLYDRGETLASGASGNPVAMFEPTLLKETSPLGHWLRHCYLFGLDYYNRLEKQGARVWKRRCGSLQLALDDKALQRQKKLLKSPSLPKGYFSYVARDEIAGLTGLSAQVLSNLEGLWYPLAGCLDTQALASFLTSGTRLNLNCSVEALSRDKTGWRLHENHGAVVGRADAVVLCQGYDIKRLEGLETLPLAMNKGQLFTFDTPEIMQGQKAILSADFYLSPPLDGRQVCGASYEQWQDENPQSWQEPDSRNRDSIFQRLKARFPLLGWDMLGSITERASLRATVSDRFPIAGPVPNFDLYRQNYRHLSLKHSPRNWPQAAYQQELYCSVGHGSKGFVMAPLVADYLACLITGDNLPLTNGFMELLHPARFMIRLLKKGKLQTVS